MACLLSQFEEIPSAALAGMMHRMAMFDFLFYFIVYVNVYRYV